MNKTTTPINPINLINLCKDHKVLIQTHNYPDPDAIGSAFGLQKFLAHYGIDATICHEGSIDKLSSLKMLSLCGIELRAYSSIVTDLKEEDYVILVDCQKDNGNTKDIVGDEVAAIDHHPTIKPIEYKYSDLRITGACSSMVANYFRTMELEPDVFTATALLYGMRMDTLQLSRGVTSFDIDMYAYLFKYADSQLLNDLESNNMEFSDLAAYGAAITNVKVFGKVGITYLEYPCPDALVATLSDFILALKEVEIAVVYALRNDGYKFSVRSERSDVHAGDLTGKALKGLGNGGGHALMAGGFVTTEKLATLGPNLHANSTELFMQVLRKDYPDAVK